MDAREDRPLWCIPAYAAFPVQVACPWPRNPAYADAFRDAFAHVRWDIWRYRQAVLEASLRTKGDDWGGYG